MSFLAVKVNILKGVDDVKAGHPEGVRCGRLDKDDFSGGRMSPGFKKNRRYRKGKRKKGMP
jgi:hypothetical protein